VAPRRTTGRYEAEHIQVLEGLQAVRKRPGMYIGGTGSAGLSHLLWELIDNAVDEAAAGHADRIDVTFGPDDSYEVGDNGRGIPVDRKNGDVTALEVVFTELHAGGKFGSGAYTASGGLHGVGASVVNALSQRIVVQVDRAGATHQLEFRDRQAGHTGAGGRFRSSHRLEKVKRVPATRTGTRVRFWPDREIFEGEATISYDEARERVSQLCFLIPGMKVRLHDRRRDTGRPAEEFVSKGGLADFVEFLSVGDAVCPPLRLEGHGTFVEQVPVEGKMRQVNRECHVEVAMRWTKGYDSRLASFVNTIPTPAGGTHVAGFERAVTFAVASALEGHRRLRRSETRVQKEDVQEGMVAVLRVVVPEPQFRGQTKEELGTPAIQSIVYGVVRDGLAEWFSRSGRRAHVKAVTDKVADAVVNRVAARHALETRRRAAQLGSTGMPDKLADCQRHPGGELLVVEGDSAAGPAKAGRDSTWQAVLPLRGKVVNAAKGSRKAVLDNAEAAALFTALGAGSGPEFALDACRYERLVLLTDADVDGSHIRCLLLTLIYTEMRPLLEAGRVYAAQPPTHAVRVGKESKTYVYSDAEMAALVEELQGQGRRPVVTRFKGLGEMNVDELAETTLDPATRVLRRITADDARQAAVIFETLMGTAVEPRRDFIIRHSAAYGHALDI
jgi:DNA gyrase subunit B